MTSCTNTSQARISVRDGESLASTVDKPASRSRPPKLLDQMREALRSRHYSRRTEQTYCQWVKRYIHFHRVRHPAEMAEPEINAFLTHLAVNEKVSVSTQNQALSALLFLYRHVLSREVGDLGEVIRARKPKRLPVVMTREEVKAVLANLPGDKWLMASLMYGSGLHLMECLRLRVQDIDFSRNEIIVRDGKGAKDRVTMLPESLKRALLDHLKKVKRFHDRDLADGWGLGLRLDHTWLPRLAHTVLGAVSVAAVVAAAIGLRRPAVEGDEDADGSLARSALTVLAVATAAGCRRTVLRA